MTVKDKILDALDIEGFILCKDEKEARELVPQLMKEMGVTQLEITSLEFKDNRAHVKLRAEINNPIPSCSNRAFNPCNNISLNKI